MNANRTPMNPDYSSRILTAHDAVRALTVARSRYLANGDEYEYENWHNASCAYYNITGKDHPLALYIGSDED